MRIFYRVQAMRCTATGTFNRSTLRSSHRPWWKYSGQEEGAAPFVEELNGMVEFGFT
jgi:hypothetical protein